mmetsp:Transcript_12587/g.27684  ORF Transcript_12587/g.27684 Transcript_12587/m.27684 type:complete len:738 (-) Transcript_12587:202-2415(-)
MAPASRKRAGPTSGDNERNANGETKEEAKLRREQQKEKRRLAAQKVEEERQRKTRKRRATADDEEEESKAEGKSTSGKRVKKAPVSARKPRGSSTKRDPEPEKEESNNPESEEMDGEKPAAKATAGRKKALAKPAATKAKAPARKTQKSKHTKPVRTPPRPATSKRGVSGAKPPFGSPKPAPISVNPPQAASPAPQIPMDPPPAADTAATIVAAAEDVKVPAATADPPTTSDTSTIPAPTMAAAAASSRQEPPTDSALPLPGPSISPFHDNYDDSDDGDFDDSDDDDDDDDHNSLRQQALRVIAERRDREYVARMQAQAAAIAREQAKMEKERKEAENKRKRWTTPLYYLFLIIMASYFLARIFPNGLDLFEVLFPSHFPKTQVCFENSHPKHLDEPNGSLITVCEPKPDDFVDMDGRKVNIVWQGCPRGAKCSGGKLEECPRLYDIHDNYCYLSTESNETLANIHKLLERWSIDAHCSVNEEANVDVGTWAARPFFHYSRVVGELECGYDPSLLFLGNETILKKGKAVPLFLLEQTEKDLWLALHPQVPITIPMTCQAARTIMFVCFGLATIVGMFASFVWSVAQHLMYLYYGAFVESPLYVGLTSLILGALSRNLYQRWLERKKKEDRENEVLRVRGLVLNRLEEAANEGRALDAERLKSDIAWAEHQMSRKGRRNMVKFVWPHVLGDINEDNRVHKVVRTENGKSVTYWKWVAPSAPTSPSMGGIRQRMVRFDQ